MSAEFEPIPTSENDKKILGLAEKEVEYRMDNFNRVAQTCFEKCVGKRHKDTELYIGENSCIDRCVSKYLQVTGIVGQVLASYRPPM